MAGSWMSSFSDEAPCNAVGAAVGVDVALQNVKRAEVCDLTFEGVRPACEAERVRDAIGIWARGCDKLTASGCDKRALRSNAKNETIPSP